MQTTKEKEKYERLPQDDRRTKIDCQSKNGPKWRKLIAFDAPSPKTSVE